MQGFVQFAEERGVVAATGLALTFGAILQEVMSSASLLQLWGNEAIVLFRSPKQALESGIRLQARPRGRTAAAGTLPLTLGIGVHLGELIPVPAGLVGKDLTRARQLCTVAGSAEIVTSERIVELVGHLDNHVFIDRGPFAFRDPGELVRVFQVVSQMDAVVAGSSARVNESEPKRATRYSSRGRWKRPWRNSRTW
jgi:class 3 adenylate cyclase